MQSESLQINAAPHTSSGSWMTSERDFFCMSWHVFFFFFLENPASCTFKDHLSCREPPLSPQQSDLRAVMNAVVFIHWPVLNDNFTSIPFSPRGSSQVAAQLPWEQETRRKILLSTKQWHLMPSPTDSVELHIQVWKQEWEVVVYLISLRVTRVACQPHSFSHSLFLFLSPAWKPIFTRTLVDILLTHIFFVCIAPLSSSHTQYIPVILNSKAQVQPCLCV